MNLLSNSGVKNGLLYGLLFLIFRHVCYMIDPKMMINGIAFLGFLIPIYYMYRSAAEERRKNEGLLSFGEAIKVTFLTFVIGSLLGSIYMYLMFNVFDTGMNDVMREVSYDNAAFFAKLLGTEDKLDLIYDQIESQNIQMTFSVVFFDYLVSLIFPGFILALIISAITKKVEA